MSPFLVREVVAHGGERAPELDELQLLRGGVVAVGHHALDQRGLSGDALLDLGVAVDLGQGIL